MSPPLLRKRSKEQDDAAKHAESTVAAPSPTSFSSKVSLSLFAIALISAVTLYTRPAGNNAPGYALCSPGPRKAVYTVDASNLQVQCLVVRGARIVDTGDVEEVKARWTGPELDVKYLKEGEVVVPGLSDSHCHILEYGASQLVPLQDGKSAEGTRFIWLATTANPLASDTVRILAEYIKSTPTLANDKNKVIEGWGYDHASWDVPVLPTAADFDSNPITRGRQIILSGRDGHSVWVSPTTLAASGPYPDEIDGGIIIRDENGEPTGVFLDTAMDLIKRPELTHTDLSARFNTTVTHALRVGLTSLHDAGLTPESFKFFSQ
ncbi:hypothetical protein DXG03_006545 [Asterophora parasitica]|uniref:Amidohydrolase 3 domain-containing protein n=1 Tax=Asterophora parasitica TaxID=117018 RepID=A0A9P7K8C2_9AGAR|nr:hypothetical protein DXG03_006545 [Asterophora parasitica]